LFAEQGPYRSMNPISRWISAETEERFFRQLDHALLVCGVLSIAILIRELGWGGTGPDSHWMWSALIAKIIIVFFIVQGLVRLAISPRPVHHLWTRKGHYGMVVLAALAFAGSNTLTQHLHTHVAPEKLRLALLALLALSQLPLVGMTLLEIARHSSTLGFRHFNAGQIFVSSFVLTAVVGAFLLKVPNATRSPETFTWMQALFTSTSAVCVTGLTVVDVETVFTPLGQGILLGLIQIGGLGIMSLTYLLGLLAGGGASLRNRYAMQSLLEERNLGEVSRALLQIVAFTLAIEAMGAFCLYQFHHALEHLPWNQRLFSAAFHAVSAFCNAGFSIQSAGMASPGISDNAPYLITLIVLITLGGLGFPVLRNLGHWATARARGDSLNDTNRLLVHTRVVLLASFALTIGGAFFFWLEHAGPESDRLLHGFFLSAAARTAGFTSYDITGLNTYALVLLGLLMFIGGSPGGTAGGVRTTAVVVLLLDVWRVLRGRQSQIVFQRKISRQIRDRALATVILSLTLLAAAAGVLRWLEPNLPAAALIFECVSAFSTTGLSLGLTPSLSEAGQGVIIFLMLVGRVGILLIATSLLQRPDPLRVDHPRGTLNI
jgi:potassium uptake TrkH family protein